MRIKIVSYGYFFLDAPDMKTAIELAEKVDSDAYKEEVERVTYSINGEPTPEELTGRIIYNPAGVPDWYSYNKTSNDGR